MIKQNQSHQNQLPLKDIASLFLLITFSSYKICPYNHMKFVAFLHRGDLWQSAMESELLIPIK